MTTHPRLERWNVQPSRPHLPYTRSRSLCTQADESRQMGANPPPQTGEPRHLEKILDSLNEGSLMYADTAQTLLKVGVQARIYAALDQAGGHRTYKGR